MTAFYNENDPYAAQWLRNLITAGHIAPGDVDERSISDVRPDDLKNYTQCHFFAGIGVWSLALRRAGWPDDSPVWTGSCPCQPFSAAGKGDGFTDERHLWPAFFHLITQRKPDRIYGEQVASKDGLGWLDLVYDDMQGMDYAVAAVDLPASAVGAPHIRQRLFFVAEHNKLSKDRSNTPHGEPNEDLSKMWTDESFQRILRGEEICGRATLFLQNVRPQEKVETGTGHHPRTDGKTEETEVKASKNGSRIFTEVPPGPPGSGLSETCEKKSGEEKSAVRLRPASDRLRQSAGCGSVRNHRGSSDCISGERARTNEPLTRSNCTESRLCDQQCSNSCLCAKHSDGQLGIRPSVDPRKSTGGKGELDETVDPISPHSKNERNTGGEADTCNPSINTPVSQHPDERLADADGGNPSAEREQCSGEQRQQPQDSMAVRLGNTNSKHPRRNPDSGLEAEGVGSMRAVCDSASASGPTDGPGPTNGIWRDADWLFCRDGKWRPVKPGSSTLASGITNRVGKLRAYGNSICVEAAKAFIEATI